MTEERLIKRERYNNIVWDYALRELEVIRWAMTFAWVLLTLGGVLLAYAEFRGQVHGAWFTGAVVLILLLTAGMMRNLANRRGWPVLLANRDCLYLIASRDTDSFIEIPWRYVKDFHAGLYGLNVRGLLFMIDARELPESDVRQLLQLPNVFERQNKVVIAIPSGLRLRKPVLARLRSLSPGL